MNKYHRAAKIRNEILDYLNANGPQTAAEILWHMEAVGIRLTRQRVGQCLGRMESIGEVMYTPGAAVSPINGRPCGAWTAAATTTRSAEETLETLGKNLRREEAEPVPEPARSSRTVYLSGDNPEIARFRSGGQGAVVRPSVGSGMYRKDGW